MDREGFGKSRGMKLKIVHETEYAFSEDVLLDPHVIRLKPMALDAQRVTGYRLQVDPQPAGLIDELDPESNRVSFAWFSGPTRFLRIVVRFHVETRRKDPYRFIIYPFRSVRLPIHYPHDIRSVLRPCLEPVSEHASLKRLATAIARTHRGNLVGFIDELVLTVSRYVEQGIRETEGVLPPVTTFNRKAGSCRDLAWLTIALLRLKGLAARFVSGYLYDPGLAGHELHAWIEVYIPGAGWRGYDPSAGNAVNERYVTVAASAVPSHTLPVTGAFRGKADSTLHTRVIVKPA